MISSVAIALLFGVACQLVLRLATSMEASGGELNALLIGLLILVFVGIGTAIAAGGTAFSALIADRTTKPIGRGCCRCCRWCGGCVYWGCA